MQNSRLFPYKFFSFQTQNITMMHHERTVKAMQCVSTIASSRVRVKRILKILQYIFDLDKTLHEIRLAGKHLTLNNQRLVKKIPSGLLSIFPRLIINLYFPYFFQVWKTSLQISILFQEFQTLYEPWIRIK